MTSTEIRKRFLRFFKDNNHTILDSAPLVTSDEKGVTDHTLFNTAGVQPLIPYILAGEHPSGPRLASAQKCLRTVDLDEVGDSTHLTFFEMLGNWSIGDYFKEQAINMSHEFLTDADKGLGLDIRSLYVTVFEGNDDAPRDEDSYAIWEKIFTDSGLDPEKRIFYMPAENNWWAAGDNGPCGPDTEMFYDVSGKHKDGLTKEEYIAADDAQEVVEIWNDVFMEFEKREGVIIGKLPKQNVDTGSGLERLTMVIQGKDNVFDTDAFATMSHEVEKITKDVRAQRIIIDHFRTATFLIADGVTPANTDRGYILRRIIRRAVLQSPKKTFLSGEVSALVNACVDLYGDFYTNLRTFGGPKIKQIIEEEIERFSQTVAKGLKEFENGERDAFILFTTYGFPLEMTIELASEKGEKIDIGDFDKKMNEHQDLSRAGAGQKFKGGLADHGEETVKLHTAHHLVLAALQKVLGPEVKQRGSNITAERMRIDFAFDRKMTDEEKTAVENQVNEWIDLGLLVVRREMPLVEAQKIGAEMEFGAKYPETVSVYFVEYPDGDIVSKEFCGGPHVENTGTLGKFVIKKEEASSAGIRRIKAVLVN